MIAAMMFGPWRRLKCGVLQILKPVLLSSRQFQGLLATMTYRLNSERAAWLTGWVLAALLLCIGSAAATLAQDFSEPDNAMRLVRVRDMLAGQSWFDSIQHRLNPPAGTPMHWAQWIDALLAGPIAVMKPLIGQRSAEIAVAFVWPLGLLAIFMRLVVGVAGEIGAQDGQRRETQWTAAIVAALAFPATEKFAPGSYDHHNVELILGIAAMWGLIRMWDHPRSALWAGAALGLAMATAAEGVPMVAVGLVVAGMLWLVRPHEFARGLGYLGLGLAASSAVMLPMLVPPGNWGKPVCDAMGAPFLGVGLIGGAIALALSRLPAIAGSSFVRRVGSSALLGGVGVFVLAKLFPQCLGGGYAALGDDMSSLWMKQISETRSLLDLLGDDPAMILTVAGAAFFGLIAAVFYLRRNWRTPEGWVVLAFLLMGWCVLTWQIRGATFATAFAIPFGAWAVAIARREYRMKVSALRAIGFAAIAVGSAAAAWASAGEALQARLTDSSVLQNYETRVSGSKACMSPAAFQSLASAPKGVMLNQFGLGAGVLVWTDHSVLAGPYHRDITGTMTAIGALRASPDAAHQIVAASVADYVVICAGAPETGFYAHHAAMGVAPEETLSAMLGRGEHPAWLEPVDLGNSPLSLYRVIR